MRRGSLFNWRFTCLFAIIAAVLVWVCLPAKPVAAAPEVVLDWAGLNAWLEAHREDGGTVVLGADIEVDELDLQGDDLAQPVVIDTAAYGLTVLTSLRSGLYGAKPYGYLTITGEGVDTPVLSYKGAYSYSSYYLNLAFLTIRAYGRDGQGGTAFYVANDLDWSHMGDAPEIYASGAGAVGIDCGGDAELTWLTVESDGVAIQAAGSLNLFACRIKGDLSADAVTLDTCDAPELPSATVLHRQISSIRAGWYLILGKPYAYRVAARLICSVKGGFSPIITRFIENPFNKGFELGKLGILATTSYCFPLHKTISPAVPIAT